MRNIKIGLSVMVMLLGIILQTVAQDVRKELKADAMPCPFQNPIMTLLLQKGSTPTISVIMAVLPLFISHSPKNTRFL